MTLDEAIQRERERAKEMATRAQLLEDVKTYDYGTWTDKFKENTIKNCKESAVEHTQLADWLQELKDRRELDRQ